MSNIFIGGMEMKLLYSFFSFSLMLAISGCADSPAMLNMKKNASCALGRGISRQVFNEAYCISDTQGATINGKPDPADPYTEFTFTYRAGFFSLDFGKLYQASVDYPIPGAKYYVYEVDESKTGYKISEGIWHLFVDKDAVDMLGKEFDPYSERVILPSVDRRHLPIKVQEAINYSLIKDYSKMSNSDIQLKKPFNSIKVEKDNVQAGLQIVINKTKLNQIVAERKKFNQVAIAGTSVREREEKIASIQQQDSYGQQLAQKSYEDQQFKQKLGAISAFVLGTGAIIKQNQISKQHKIAQQNAAYNAQIAQQNAQLARESEFQQQIKSYSSSSNQSKTTQDHSSSNQSNTTQANYAHKERVNLPTENGCINIQAKKTDRASGIQWVVFINSCAYPVTTTWCNFEGCENSSGSTTISGGSSYETWVPIKNNSWHVSPLSCPLKSGSDEVYTDWPSNQCWANVMMQ